MLKVSSKSYHIMLWLPYCHEVQNTFILFGIHKYWLCTDIIHFGKLPSYTCEDIYNTHKHEDTLKNTMYLDGNLINWFYLSEMYAPVTLRLRTRKIPQIMDAHLRIIWLLYNCLFFLNHYPPIKSLLYATVFLLLSCAIVFFPSTLH